MGQKCLNSSSRLIPCHLPFQQRFRGRFQHSSQEPIKLGCVPCIDGILPRNTGHHRPFFNHKYFTCYGLPFLRGSRSSLHPLLKACHQTSQPLMWDSHSCFLFLGRYGEVGSLQTSISALHLATIWSKGQPHYHEYSRRPFSILHGQIPHAQSGMRYSGTSSLVWSLASSC